MDITKKPFDRKESKLNNQEQAYENEDDYLNKEVTSFDKIENDWREKIKSFLHREAPSLENSGHPRFTRKTFDKRNVEDIYFKKMLTYLTIEKPIKKIECRNNKVYRVYPGNSSHHIFLVETKTNLRVFKIIVRNEKSTEHKK